MQIFPFCPNPQCVWHLKAPAHPWARPKGFYTTKAFGRIRRYQCPACHTTFSSQTFSLAYYVKRPLPLADILARLSSGESLRAMSRNLSVSLSLLSNRIERLARQALALHATCLAGRIGYDDICIDGFVSFDTSQYFPSEIPIALTAHSQFILDFSHASRKRSGSMTPSQKAKAGMLYRRICLERGALSRSFRETLLQALTFQPPHSTTPLSSSPMKNPTTSASSMPYLLSATRPKHTVSSTGQLTQNCRALFQIPCSLPTISTEN